MNISRENNFNWLDVIFKDEFLYSLDLESIKEFSLASKLTRLKLHNILFKKIQLSAYKFDFNFTNNIFIEYFNYINTEEYFRDTPTPTERYRKSLKIENGLNDIKTGLQAYRNIAKSFCLYEVQRIGYYLFSIHGYFNKLTSLKIYICTIPYSEFSKIGELLPNLEDIEFNSVTISKLSSEITLSSNFKFPAALKRLKINGCNLSITDIVSNPYNYLFSKNAMISVDNFAIPKCKVPSLRTLQFTSNDVDDNGLNDFLELNPNIDSLAIRSYDLDQNKFDLIKRANCLKNLRITTISDFSMGIQFPTLNSINSLTFDYIEFNNYEDINSMCLACPNLIFLQFSTIILRDIQNSIDSYIVPILSNLTNLKTFHFGLTTRAVENIDFTNLSHIEAFEFDSDQRTILNTNFSNCSSLKKIYFRSKIKDPYTQEFKDRFSSIKNWKFKFGSRTIKGYKLAI